MRALYLGSIGLLIALIGLCIAWELFLAPLRPGGSWLVLKVLPLLLPLPGLLQARRYTAQWGSLLCLAYFIEGVVRAYSDTAPSRYYALTETVLAVCLFFSLIFLARELGKTGRKKQSSA